MRPLTEARVAKGVQRAYTAFLAALPDLLKSAPGRSWAAFHGDDFVAIGSSERALYQKCLGLGFPLDSIFVGWIAPHSADGVEEIDPSLFEFEEPRRGKPS